MQQTLRKIASDLADSRLEPVIEVLKQPANRRSRAAFVAATGIDPLPRTQKGSDAALRQWWSECSGIPADEALNATDSPAGEHIDALAARFRSVAELTSITVTARSFRKIGALLEERRFKELCHEIVPKGQALERQAFTAFAGVGLGGSNASKWETLERWWKAGSTFSHVGLGVESLKPFLTDLDYLWVRFRNNESALSECADSVSIYWQPKRPKFSGFTWARIQAKNAPDRIVWVAKLHGVDVALDIGDVASESPHVIGSEIRSAAGVSQDFKVIGSLDRFTETSDSDFVVDPSIVFARNQRETVLMVPRSVSGGNGKASNVIVDRIIIDYFSQKYPAAFFTASSAGHLRVVTPDGRCIGVLMPLAISNAMRNDVGLAHRLVRSLRASVVPDQVSEVSVELEADTSPDMAAPEVSPEFESTSSAELALVDPGEDEAPGEPNYLIPDDLAATLLVERPRDTMLRHRQILELLTELEDSPRSLTTDEQRVFAGYSGWGPYAGELMDLRLQQLLGKDRVPGVLESTPTAFYTAPAIVDAMWAMARKAGFTGGTVLEPGAGAGWFLGRVPEGVRERTRFVAVEREPIAARVLAALYPQATVYPCDFRVAPLPDNSVDLVIGNVPYSDERVNDSMFDHAMSVHDYFLARSLRALRPGGVLVCLTSTWTLDKSSPSARSTMHGMADLCHAARLPMGALVRTQVSADIVVLRKRLPNMEPAPFTWMLSNPPRRDDEAPETGRLLACRNEAFDTGVAIPMGTHTTHGVRGITPIWVAQADGRDVPASLVQTMPADLYQPWTPEVQPDEPEAQPQRLEATEGCFVVHGDGVGYIENGRVVPVAATGRALQRLQAYIPLREAACDVLSEQVANCSDEALAEAQAVLTRAYDRFVEKFGPINRTANRRAILGDPYHDLILALEYYDPETEEARKAEFFTQRTIHPQTEPEPETALDAMLASVDRYGEVRTFALERWLGRPWKQIREELRGQVFDDPATGRVEMAELYCSGDLRKKLETARVAAMRDPRYRENIEALTLALGPDLPRDNISMALGVPWVEPREYAAFLREVLYPNTREADLSVFRDSVTGAWRVKCFGAENPTYSTKEWKAFELVEEAMNGRAPKVYYPSKDGEPKRLNESATMLAVSRMEQVQAAFAAWVWMDEERAQRVCAEYNEKFNSFRGPNLRSMKMTLPGLAPGTITRDNQDRGILRVITQQSTLLGHWVGAGKTLTMIGAAVKLRQLGIASRSIVLVKKSTLFSIAAEARRFFPTLRVAIIEPADLNPAGRREFLRRFQTQAPHLVVTTHEAWRKIELPPEVEIKGVGAVLARLEGALADMDGSKNAAEVKRLGRAVSKLRGRLGELVETSDGGGDKRQPRIRLDDLGVQALFVDEFQAFKNLQIETAEQMLGIPTSASARALDMHLKIEYLREQGARIVGATGTPITNSLCELYNLMRYFGPDMLRAAGVDGFDAWKVTFASPVSRAEPDPGGAGYRMVQRLAGVRNVPTLVAMASRFTDVVTEGDLKIPRPEAEHQVIEVEPTPLQTLYRQALMEQTQIVRSDPKLAGELRINILTVLGSARRAALDLRAMYPFVDADQGGEKIPTVVSKVAEIYHATRERKLTQSIFCDLATPQERGSMRFSSYEAIRSGLVEAGIPASEVAFIHECKTDRDKESLFRRVRGGDVAVLIGSTGKMGEGCNFQDRLIAQHHLNSPYHPGELVQRNGRIIRFGNQNANVTCYYYTTRGLLEDWNWGLVRNKQGFINSIMNALANNQRLELTGIPQTVDEDVAAMDIGQVISAASGDPRVARKFELETEIARLTVLARAEAGERVAAEKRLRDTRWTRDSLVKDLHHAEEVRDIIDAERETLEGRFRFVFDSRIGQRVKMQLPEGDKRKEVGEALIEVTHRIADASGYQGVVDLPLGTIEGVPVTVSVTNVEGVRINVGFVERRLVESFTRGSDPVGTVRSIESRVDKLVVRAESLARSIGDYEKQIASLEAHLAKPPAAVGVDKLTEELADLDRALQGSNAMNADGAMDRFNKRLMELYGQCKIEGPTVDDTSLDAVREGDGVETEDDEIADPSRYAFDRLLESIDGLRDASRARLKADGFMDLVVETLRTNGFRQEVSFAHYYEQNGDLVADPDMVVMIDWKTKSVTPVSYKDAYRYRKASESPREFVDQSAFFATWMRNIKFQGHQVVELVRQEPEEDQAQVIERAIRVVR